MASSRFAFMAVAIVAAVLALGVAPVAAEIPDGPCDCYVGTVSSAAPCVCACPADWLPPRCNFKADWTIELRLLVLDDTFASDNFVRTIALRTNTTSASFRRKTGSSLIFGGVTVLDVRIVVSGRHVAGVLGAIESQPSWVVALGIVAADLSKKVQASAFEPDRLVIYANSAPAFTITASSYGWFLAAVVIVLLLPSVEMCCCISHSAADVEALEMEEAAARRYELAHMDGAATADGADGAVAVGQPVAEGQPVGPGHYPTDADTNANGHHYPTKPQPQPLGAASARYEDHSTMPGEVPHSPREDEPVAAAMSEDQQRAAVFTPPPEAAGGGAHHDSDDERLMRMESCAPEQHSTK